MSLLSLDHLSGEPSSGFESYEDDRLRRKELKRLARKKRRHRRDKHKKSRRRASRRHLASSKSHSKLDEIPLYDHEHRHSSENDDVCAVCLSGDRMDCQLAPCNHVFHGACISKWVKRNFSCPMCRTEIAQFVPIGKKRKNRVMREFEQLWINHYLLGGKEERAQARKTASEKDGLAKPKILEMIVEEDPIESPKEVLSATTDEEKSPELILEIDDSLLIQDKSTTQIPDSSPVQIQEKPMKKPVSLWTNLWKYALYSQSLLSSHVSSQVNPSVTTLAVQAIDLQTKNEPISHDEETLQWGIHPSPFITNDADDLIWDDSDKTQPIPTQIESENTREYPDKANFQQVRAHTWLNAQSGAVAGLAAAMGSSVMANYMMIRQYHGIRMNPWLLNAMARNTLQISMETIPTVAAFFVSYEHLKHYFFEDSQNKSRTQAFGDRFISAGLAGTIASATMGAKSPILGLRFAAFFGSFEMLKDFKSTQNNAPRPLNMAEIACAASIGGFGASALYYPSMKAVQHVSKSMISLNPIGLAVSVNPTGSSFMSTRTAMTGALKEIAIHPSILFRGFIPHVSSFLPSCVACSCAFEAARRHFTSKQD